MSLLAHQGGWDEILLVLGPILVIAGLLLVAKRRVERGAEPVGPTPTTGGDEQRPEPRSTDGPDRG